MQRPRAARHRHGCVSTVPPPGSAHGLRWSARPWLLQRTDRAGSRGEAGAAPPSAVATPATPASARTRAASPGRAGRRAPDAALGRRRRARRAPAGRGMHGTARAAVRPIAKRPGNPSRRAARAGRERTAAHSATPRSRLRDMKVMPMESRFLARHAGTHDRGTRHGAPTGESPQFSTMACDRARRVRSSRWRRAQPRMGRAGRRPVALRGTAAADRGRRSRDAPSPPDACQRVVPCADRRAHDARRRAAPRRPAAPDASSPAGTRRGRFMRRRSPAKPSAVPAGPHIRSPHALVVGAPAGARTGRQGAARAARISTKVSTAPVLAT